MPTIRRRDIAVLRVAALEALLRLERMPQAPPQTYPPLLRCRSHNTPGRFRALVTLDGRLHLIPLDQQ